jgi:hypothetical protein
MMVDGAIRLLSLANQLTRRVRLNFEEGEFGTMGYLNRMGFFDHLHPDIEVLPGRPLWSVSTIDAGGEFTKCRSDSIKSCYCKGFCFRGR